MDEGIEDGDEVGGKARRKAQTRARVVSVLEAASGSRALRPDDLPSAPDFTGMDSSGAVAPISRVRRAQSDSEIVAVETEKRRLSYMRANSANRKIARTDVRPECVPITMMVFRYGERAADHIPEWPATAEVFQLQFIHEAEQSYATNIESAFNEYLSYLHAKLKDFPASLQELKRDRNMVLQVTNAAEGRETGAPLVDRRVWTHPAKSVSAWTCRGSPAGSGLKW